MSIITDTTSCKITIKRIHNYSTLKSIEELKRHILLHLIVPENYDMAKLDYSVNAPTQEDLYSNPGYYPLKFISKNRNEEIWISCVTAGYHGEGPAGSVEALKLMGFVLPSIDEEKIYSSKDAHLKFKK